MAIGSGRKRAGSEAHAQGQRPTPKRPADGRSREANWRGGPTGGGRSGEARLWLRATAENVGWRARQPSEALPRALPPRPSPAPGVQASPPAAAAALLGAIPHSRGIARPKARALGAAMQFCDPAARVGSAKASGTSRVGFHSSPPRPQGHEWSRASWGGGSAPSHLLAFALSSGCAPGARTALAACCPRTASSSAGGPCGACGAPPAPSRRAACSSGARPCERST